MLVLTLIFCGLNVLLLMLLFRYRKAYLSILDQLKELQRKSSSNHLLRNDIPIFGSQKLCQTFNELIQNLRHQKREKQEELEKVRSEMANLSHDIRTPLTALAAYLQISHEAICEGHIDEAKDVLTRAIRRNQATQKLVNAIYEVARYEDQSAILDRCPVDPGLQLKEQILALYDEMNQRKLDVQVDIQPNPKTELAPHELDRIFQNLLQNAIRYAYSYLKIQHHSNQDGILETRFTNDLIPGHQQHINPERLFDRFYTGNSARSNRNGSGLGLYLAHLLARRMGLSLEAELKPDTISFILRYPNNTENTALKPGPKT